MRDKKVFFLNKSSNFFYFFKISYIYTEDKKLSINYEKSI